MSATAAAPASARPRPFWVFGLIGAGAAAVALVPWLITGGRMPLQNLWSELPADIPIVLLPFHPYTATLVAALLLLGAALAGLTARALGAARTRWGTTALLTGTVLVQAVAIAQSALTTRGTLPDRSDADLYVAVLTAGAVLSLLLGTGVAALVARAPLAGAVIGLTVGAIAAGPWLAAIIVPFGSTPTEMPPLLAVVQWVPPVLAGVAIAWAGVNSVGRALAAVGAVALVWIAPAALTGVGYSLGSRVMWNDPAAMIDGAVQVFGLALLTPELAWRPIVACGVTAVVGLGVGALVRRRSSRAEEGRRHA